MNAKATAIPWHMPDLRLKHDVSAKLIDATLYLHQTTVQVWWEVDALGRPFKRPEDGRETWTCQTISQAVHCFMERVNIDKEERDGNNYVD